MRGGFWDQFGRLALEVFEQSLTGNYSFVST
jgi:hypothetical protein